MADVKMPKSVPCKFDDNWRGICEKPSTNGWCSKHEKLKCASCRKKATCSCDAGLSLICGAPLCKDCTHAPNGGGHVTKKVANKFYRKEEEERKETEASRNSKVQRMDEELGVPLNLFELLKGDTTEWPIKEFYFLELEHGLMGFFPAIIRESRRIVLTLDPILLKKIWRMLSPRKSSLVTKLCYVSERKGLLYPKLGDSQFDNEESKPAKFLTQAEFDELTRNGANPFCWAPGLIGSDMSHEDFAETIRAATKEYDVKIGATK